MAVNPPVNPILDPLASEIEATVSQANKLRDALANAASAAKSLGGNFKDNLEYVGKILEGFEKNEKKIDDLTDKITEFNTAQQSGSLIGTSAQLTELNNLIQTVDKSVIKRRTLMEQTNILTAMVRDYESGGNRYSLNQIENQKDQVKLLNQELDNYKKAIGDQQYLENLIGKELATKLREYIINKNLLEQAEDYKDNHEDAYHFLQGSLREKEKEIAKNAYILSQREKELKQIVENHFVLGQISKISKEIGNILGFQNITMGAILKGAFDLNKTFIETAKTLGTTGEYTKLFSDNIAKSSASAGTLASFGSQDVITRKEALKAQVDLNKALGTSADFSKERVQDQIFLTKIMGLEAEQAIKIQQLSIISGKSNKEIIDSVNNQTIALGKQTGIYLDNKKILTDVAKVEGQLAAQYQNNPELLSRAVIQVKQLGIELSQAANMSNKLLNFQSSIQSELEAELLIGKSLNFERARELALRGDSAAAAKEMLDQVGGLTEFQDLNVIQQRSLAESMGMSADELANSLKTQDLLLKTGDKSLEALNERRRLAAETGKSEEFLQELRRAGTSEQMIANQAELSNQDKMTALVDKMLESFQTMVEPMTNLVSLAMDFLNAIGGVKTLVGIIGGIWIGKIAASIAATGASLALQTGQLAAQIQLQKILTVATKQKAIAEGAAAAFSFGPLFPIAIGGVAAILAGLGIAASFGAFSGGGESSIGNSTINNKQNNTPQNQQQNTNTEVTIYLGPKALTTMNVENNKSQTSYA